MNQSNQFYRHVDVTTATLLPAQCGKEKSDLRILHYMLRRTYGHLFNLPANIVLPSLDYIDERRHRTHRVVIYKPQELLLASSLFFVGFASCVQEQVSAATLQELHRVDKLLVAEVASNPGLFSYSSLEVHHGFWYNLVILSDSRAKGYFRGLAIHTYAAQQLAVSYYRWIRLHNGLLPGGLLSNEMVLQCTKYYTFSPSGQEPPTVLTCTF